MQRAIFNKIIVSICVLFVAGTHQAFSFKQTFHQKVSGGMIHQNLELMVADPLVNDNLNAVYAAVVELSYGKELMQLNQNPWDASIEYTIFLTNSIGTTTEIDNQQLEINYGTPSPQVINFREYDLESSTVSIRIDNVTGEFHDDVHLKLFITKEAEVNDIENELPGAMGYDAQQELLYWTYFPGATSYEVDWVYKDHYSEKYETPVSVTSTNNYLPWHTLHEAGALYFRVRPIYSYQGGQLKGNHSFASSPLIIGENQSFENDKNWSCVLTYLEDGRFKQAIEYTDGQGDVRQSMVNVQSQKVTAVKEVKYDSEGRVAIDILPVPVPQLDGNNPFAFQANLNSFDGSQGITAFDQGAGAAPLTPTSGTSQYYSPNNTMDFSGRDYIPDAEGYPFVQYQYKTDGTGRMVRQSNVGEELRLHNGASEDQHYASFFYGTPKAAELNRLFGSNVGKPQNYQKTVSVDPNGQMAVSYIDGNGQTIATALAGEKPSSLTAIASYPQSPRGLASPLITNDDALTDGIHRSSVNTLINLKKNTGYTFNYSLDGIINQFDPCIAMNRNMLEDLRPGGELYNEAFLNHVDYASVNLSGLGANPETIILDAENYQESWALSLIPAHPLYADYQTCLGSSTPICNECIYDLSIKVIDPDGVVMSPVIEHTFDASEIGDKCSVSTYNETIPSQDYIFGKIGEYTVVKTLTLSDGAIDALVARLEQEKPDGFPDLEDIKANYLANIDYSSCAETCEDRCRFELLAGGFTDGTSDFNEAYDDCVQFTCNDDDLIKEGEQMECDNLLTAMRNQIKPGGFWNGSLGNESDLISEMTLPGIGGDRIASLQNPDEWNNFWFEELVPELQYDGSSAAFQNVLNQKSVHPEYHHYKLCVLEVNSKVFDSKLLEVSSWEEGVSTGYVNPTGTNPYYNQPSQVDPFYSRLVALGLGSIMTSKMNVFKTDIDVDGNGYLDHNDYVSIWEFSQLNISEGQTPTTSEGKWRLFTGSYFNLKSEKREALLMHILGCSGSGCIYLNPSDYLDENNKEIPGVVLVPGPKAYPTDRAGAEAWNNNQISENCAANVGTLAEGWIARLEGCSGVVLAGTQLSTVQSRFESYFMAHCGYSNPVNILAREDIATDPDLQAVVAVNPAFEECLYNMAVSRGAAYRENCEVKVEVYDSNLILFDLIEGLYASAIEKSLENPIAEIIPLYPGESAFDDFIAYVGPQGQNWKVRTGPASAPIETWDRVERLNFYVSSGAVYAGSSNSNPGVIFPIHPGPGFNIHDFKRILKHCGHEMTVELHSGEVMDQNVVMDGSTPFVCQERSETCLIEANNECGCMDDALYSLSAQDENVSYESTYFQDSGVNWVIKEAESEFLKDVLSAVNLGLQKIQEGPSKLVLFGSEEYFQNNWTYSTAGFNELIYHDVPGFNGWESASGYKILGYGVNMSGSIYELRTISNENLAYSQVMFKDYNTGAKLRSFPLPFDRIVSLNVNNKYQSNYIEATVVNDNNGTTFKVWFNYYSDPTAKPISSCKKSGYDHLTLSNDHLSMRKEASGDLMNIYVYDENGNPFVFDDLNNAVVSISVPDYVHTSPITNQPSGVFYAHYQVLVEYKVGDATEVEAGYLYVDNVDDLNEPFFNECFVEQPTVESDDPFTLCADNKEREAEVLAAQQYEKELANYLTNYLNESVNTCFDRPYNEHFSYSSNVKEYHYTLYYYDQAGNLIQTVPPEGVKPVDVTLADYDVNDNYIGDEPDHGIETKYKYDGLGNLVWQSTPDGGETRYWYDDKLRLRLSQNEKQRNGGFGVGKYTYTSYDYNNRVVEVGQLHAFEFSDNQLMDPVVFSNQIQPVISQNNWPLNTDFGRSEITTTYYDQAGEGVQMVLNNTRNSVAQVVKKEFQDDPLSNFYAFSYSKQGVLTDLEQQIPGLGKKHVSYDYDMISGNVNEVTYQKGEADQIIHRYGYDEDNRLKSVETSTDGWVWQEEANYTYYPHGPLARVELGEDKVQGLDYLYTLQGWIKGVNTPHLASGNVTKYDPGNDGITGANEFVAQDEFAYTLSFFKNDYSPIGNVSLGASSSLNMFHEIGGTSNGVLNDGLYNGNITAMATQVKGMGEKLGLSNEAADMKGLNMAQYQHDQLNRLTKSSTFHNLSATAWGSANMFANNTSYSYDENGNILHLTRNNQGSLMDDLSYDFDYGMNHYGEEILLNNRLNHVAEPPALDMANVDDVTDQSTFNNGKNYKYDYLGNLASDASEEIKTIDWTLSGKVRRITREAGSSQDDLEFIYDAMDNRVVKIVKPHDAQSEDDYDVSYYSMDAQGTVMANYKRSEDDHIILTDQPIYGGDRIGVMQRNVAVGEVVKKEIKIISYSFEADEDNVLTSEPTVTATTAHTGLQSYKQEIQYGSALKVAIGRGDVITELSVYGRMENTPSGTPSNVVLTIRDDQNNILHGANNGTQSTWDWRLFQSTTSFEKLSFENVQVPPELYTVEGILVTGNVFLQASVVNPQAEANPVYIDDWYLRVERDLPEEQYYVQAAGLGDDRNLTLRQRNYELKDHLGNVRAVVSDHKLMASRIAGNDIFFYSFEEDEKNILDGTPEFTTEIVATGNRAQVQTVLYGREFMTEVFRGDLVKEFSRKGLVESPSDPYPAMVLSITDEAGNILHTSSNGTSSTWQSRVYKNENAFEKMSFDNVIIPSNLFTQGGQWYSGRVFIKSNTVNPQFTQHAVYFDDLFVEIERADQTPINIYEADLVSCADYYPFGMEVPGSVYSGDYRYGFNGMEKDDEVKGSGNSYSSHYRINDPRIARWTSLDPKAELYPDESPYVSMGNGPILNIDPLGDSYWHYLKGRIFYRTVFRIITNGNRRRMAPLEPQDYFENVPLVLKRLTRLQLEAFVMERKLSKIPHSDNDHELVENARERLDRMINATKESNYLTIDFKLETDDLKEVILDLSRKSKDYKGYFRALSKRNNGIFRAITRQVKINARVGRNGDRSSLYGQPNSKSRTKLGKSNNYSLYGPGASSSRNRKVKSKNSHSGGSNSGRKSRRIGKSKNSATGGTNKHNAGKKNKSK